MPNLTSKGLKKPLTTEAYDVEVVNFNSDKINELFVAQDTTNENVSQQMEQKADIKKTIYRQNYKGFTQTETLADYIKTQATNGYVYGSIWCNGASDMNSLAGFVTWKLDSGATAISNVVLESTIGKVYNRLLNISNGAWIDTKWSEQATTDKIDISSTLAVGWQIYAADWIGFEITKSGAYCNINANIKNTSIINTDSTIANISDINYKPKKRMPLKLMTYNSSTMYNLAIYPDGTIRTTEQIPVIGGSFYYINGGYSII